MFFRIYDQTYPRVNEQVFMNLELALEEDPDNAVVKQKLSKLLYNGSNK